jgi:hypothetical protein
VTELVRCGIGSLPHRDPAAAADFVLATSDIPYLPQLPNRHPEEAMLVQWGDGIEQAGPRDRILAPGATAGPREEAFRGAGAMLDRLHGGTIKTQATGPATLTAALLAAGADSPGLLDRVAEQLQGRISDHLGWIRATSDPDRIVLMLDEPALAATGGERPIPQPVLAVLGGMIDAFDVEVGVHCCGDTDWGAIAALRPDWLSWDLSALGSGFAGGVDDVAAALAAGSRVMWGIVPTMPGPLPEQNVLLHRYGTAVATLIVAGAPLSALRDRAWFTPACGLAGLAVDDAEMVARRLGCVVEEVEHGW